MSPPVIYLHAEAPPKPLPGETCNGCGLCCASEPCPLGMVLSRRRQGACAALRWVEDERRYRCDVLHSPDRWLAWLPRPWARRWTRRWIAAGRGCDCDLLPG